MRTLRYAAVLFAAAVGSGCATAGPKWTPADGTVAPSSRGYAIRFPRGWLWLGDRDAVVASRDGLYLQRIDAFQQTVGRPMGGTRKTISMGMLPQEVADVVQDALVSSPEMQGVTILENAPAPLDGHPGFRLEVAYKDRDGLRMRSILCGALVGDLLYELSYTAPERHYFDRDLETFEQVRSTFKISPAAVARARTD
ncbi:MAG TPA: hypothetical protein VG496_10550 [Myxococcales bacterium]|nr:hypothetical protein [Myxococcales bacterium]